MRPASVRPSGIDLVLREGLKNEKSREAARRNHALYGLVNFWLRQELKKC